MNENAKKWVEALRSGKYKQTDSGLRLRDSFCCLGVASEVFRQETGQGHWGNTDQDDYASFILDDEHEDSGYLVPAVTAWLGLRSDNGAYEDEAGSPIGSLTAHNDIGDPFTKIADIIESEPPGLFVSAPDAGGQS